MNSNEKGILERLAALSLERCLVKLAKVSAASWQLSGTAGATATLSEAIGQYDFKDRHAAAVHVDVKGGGIMTTLMMFDTEDMDSISKCFLGYSFPRGKGVSQPDEVMLLELANIVLNSLCNSVMNALQASLIPSVPRYAGGDRAGLAAALGASTGQEQKFRTVAAGLAMQSGNISSKCTVLVLIPEDVALQLEGMVA